MTANGNFSKTCHAVTAHQRRGKKHGYSPSTINCFEKGNSGFALKCESADAATHPKLKDNDHETSRPVPLSILKGRRFEGTSTHHPDQERIGRNAEEPAGRGAKMRSAL